MYKIFHKKLYDKLIYTALLALLLLLLLPSAGCARTYEIAMITYGGKPQDDAFSASVWCGIQEYAAANNRSFRYYIPEKLTNEAYLKAVKKAVDGGARVVIFPGYVFGETILAAQSEYPAVSFIILDGDPTNISGGSIADNACAVLYNEAQAGFLAGYAAVKNGFTKLGFIGGMQIAGVIRYGYGFVSGAEYAANEMGVNVTMYYTYTGSFAATPQLQSQAEAWYNEGIEVIFACGENLENSVVAAAEKYENTWVIGYDTDRSAESDRVCTSACKALTVSVKYILSLYFGGAFPSGKCLMLGVSEGAVMLPMNTSHFNAFIQEDYDNVYALLSSELGSMLPNETNVFNVLKISVSHVKIIVQ